MKTLPISEFQKNCQSFLHEVESTGETILLLREGVPVSQLSPYRSTQTKTLFGAHQGQLVIHGNILSPLKIQWDVLE
jgi:antitoxin (DNA-binding transcriptional repressor) of toxin-antitoxin stability system